MELFPAGEFICRGFCFVLQDKVLWFSLWNERKNNEMRFEVSNEIISCDGISLSSLLLPCEVLVTQRV